MRTLSVMAVTSMEPASLGLSILLGTNSVSNASQYISMRSKTADCSFERAWFNSVWSGTILPEVSIVWRFFNLWVALITSAVSKVAKVAHMAFTDWITRLGSKRGFLWLVVSSSNLTSSSLNASSSTVSPYLDTAVLTEQSKNSL